MEPITRRNLLVSSGTVAGAVASSLGKVRADEAPSHRPKVVVAGGHPGDPEAACGGTMARMVDLGHEVVALYVTRGEGGIRGKSRIEAGTIRTEAAKKAQVVMTHWPIDTHRDHRTTSLLVYDAWLACGRKFALYYYEVSTGEETQLFRPTHYVNITGTETRKRAACFAHASQDPKKFYAYHEEMHRFRGFEGG